MSGFNSNNVQYLGSRLFASLGNEYPKLLSKFLFITIMGVANIFLSYKNILEHFPNNLAIKDN